MTHLFTEKNREFDYLGTCKVKVVNTCLSFKDCHWLLLFWCKSEVDSWKSRSGYALKLKMKLVVTEIVGHSGSENREKL